MDCTELVSISFSHTYLIAINPSLFHKAGSKGYLYLHLYLYLYQSGKDNKDEEEEEGAFIECIHQASSQLS